MSFTGKLHEISFYGLCTTIVTLICGKVSISSLRYAAVYPDSFPNVFQCYLFWASVMFIPIAAIRALRALVTKEDCGPEFLFDSDFDSDDLFIIVFLHIGQEILRLFIAPFRFLGDLFSKKLTEEKIADFILYIIELVFIAIGLTVLSNSN